MKHVKYFSFLITLALCAQSPLLAMKRRAGEEADNQPIAKRTRSSYLPATGDFGKLPAELLTEIFSFLDFKDLLQVNKTCKALQPAALVAINHVPYPDEIYNRHTATCDSWEVNKSQLENHVDQGSHFIQAVKAARHAKSMTNKSNYNWRSAQLSMQLYRALIIQGQVPEEEATEAAGMGIETGSGSVVRMAKIILNAIKQSNDNDVREMATQPSREVLAAQDAEGRAADWDRECIIS